jgi:hypothetical protein
MTQLRTSLISAMQRRLQLLIQPLHDAQAAFGSETIRRLDDTSRALVDLQRHVNAAYESLLFSRWMDKPNVLATRNEAGYWLNSLGLFGEGVEVGVFRGEYSNEILRTWRGSRLTSIDPWREFAASEYVDMCNTTQTDQEINYQSTAATLSKFAERSRILRMTSLEAASQFEGESLDFVYLDAQHHYEAVRDDIRLWLPKVRRGGVLGGHDYLDGRLPSGQYGVKQAVQEMVASTGNHLVITHERDWPSWYVVVA